MVEIQGSSFAYELKRVEVGGQEESLRNDIINTTDFAPLSHALLARTRREQDADQSQPPTPSARPARP